MGVFKPVIRGGANITGATEKPVIAGEALTKGDTIAVQRVANTVAFNQSRTYGTSVLDCQYSSNGTRVAILYYSSGYKINMYSISSGVYTNLGQVVNSATRPYMALSSDGTRLAYTQAFGMTGSTSCLLKVLNVAVTTIQEYSNTTVLPAADLCRCVWNNDATQLFVWAAGSSGSDDFTNATVFKRTGTTYTSGAYITFSSSALATYGANFITDASYDSTGIKLALALTRSPYVMILYSYEVSTYSRLAGPITPPTGGASSVSWSSDGSRLAVTHDNSPYVTIYNTVGAGCTKISNPSTLPTGNALACAWSKSDNVLVVTHVTSPYITVYKVPSYIKLSSPATLPNNRPDVCRITPDGTSIMLAGVYLNTIHEYRLTYLEMAYKAYNNASSASATYGYAKSNIANGVAGTMIKLFNT